MYFVVNSSLSMGKGKIASQVAHGAIQVFRRHPQTRTFRHWDSSHQAKVVLQAPRETLLELAQKYSSIAHPIYDAGKTQVDPGSLTVLAFEVMEKESNPDLVKLKLL
jgi:PTH2 family peptidyl-tRNA hydrolase